MAVVENIEVEVSIDKNKVDREFNNLRDDIEWFNKRIASDEASQLALSVSLKEQELRKARTRLRQAIKDENQEAEIEIRTDIQKLSQGLTQARRELRNFARTGEKDVSVLWNLFNSVNDEIKKSRDELNKLWLSGAKLDKVEKSFQDLTNEARNGKISIEQYRKELGKISEEARGSWSALWRVGVSIEDFSKRISPAVIAVTGIWAALGWVTNAVLPLDDAFRKLDARLLNSWRNIDELRDVLLELDNLWFTQLNEGVDIISTLAVETGATNEQIRETALWIANISGIFEKDFNETLRASTALQKTFGLEGSQANDLITRALQESGDTYDDLLDSINEYAAIAADAQIPVERFINTLIEGTRLGIRNTDELADVQREFTLRIRDWSKASREAINELGLDYDKLTNDINSGATTVAQAQTLIANSLLEIEEETTRVQLATDLLGTRYEDNGDIILEVLANVSDEIENLEWATEDLVDESQTGLSNLGREFRELLNLIKETALPVINLLANTLAFVLDKITKLADAVINFGKRIIENNIIIQGAIRLFNRLVDIIWIKTANAFDDAGSEADNLNKKLEETEKALDNLEDAQKKYNKAVEENAGSEIIEKYAKDVEVAEKEVDKLTWSTDKLWDSLNNTWEKWRKSAENIQRAFARADEDQKRRIQEQQRRLERFQNERLRRAERTAQREIQIAKSAQAVLDNQISESKSNIENYASEIESVKDSFKSLRDSAAQDLKSIQEEFENIWFEEGDRIAQRVIEIQNRLSEISKSGGITSENSDEVEKLNQELKLARENTTQARIDEIRNQELLNPTEQIIQEIEAERERLRERKKSIQSQLDAEQERVKKEVLLLEEKTTREKELIEGLGALRVRTEQFITARLSAEAQKQIENIEKVEEATRRLIDLQKQAGLSWSIPSIDSNQTTRNTRGNNNNFTFNISDFSVRSDDDIDVIVDRVSDRIVRDFQNWEKNSF